MWTQILQEQSDLCLHCLTKILLKHFSRRQKQTTFVVIGALKVQFANIPKCKEYCKTIFGQFMRSRSYVVIHQDLGQDFFY